MDAADDMSQPTPDKKFRLFTKRDDIPTIATSLPSLALDAAQEREGTSGRKKPHVPKGSSHQNERTALNEAVSLFNKIFMYLMKALLV